MKLKSIRLENFRQFYGDQVISFAEDDQKNVTIVFGANGAGKTTLLNAFTWTFYNICSAGFEQPERLINERRWLETGTGETASARVTIEFEDGDILYTATRTTTDRKRADGGADRMKDAEVNLEFRGEDGRTRRADNPSDRLNQILPDHLHAFFFFNGERIEALAKESSSREIETGIKNLLGLEIVERAIRHLSGDVRKRLQGELHDVGTREVQDVLDTEERARGEIERKQAEQRQARENEEAWKRELSAVFQRLRTLEDAQLLQQQRDTLTETLDLTQAAIASSRSDLSALISKRGFLAFTRDLCAQCDAVLRAKRERGEIPTGIKQQFVQDLLDAGRCICGTHLRDGEVPHAQVKTWLGKAGTTEIEEASIRAAAAVLSFEREWEEMSHSLDTMLAKLQEHRNLRRRLEEQLSEVTRKLGGQESEEIRDLEARREQLVQRISQENRHFGALATELAELERQHKDLQDQIKKLNAADAKGKLAKRRLEVCQEATELFRKILDARIEEVRQSLSEGVRSIYSRISYKAYTPILTDDYHLVLQKVLGDEDGTVAKSTGENQILSLAFIGAIADIARDRYRRSKEQPNQGLLSFRGGIYPLVMDSPFGALDENYRMQIARAIPQLAPQTIIFVSKSQGLGSVMDELAPRLGRAYVLAYHTSKSVEPETIEIHGRRSTYITSSNNGTEFVLAQEIV
jgi:DNA sulfur modification protein DndD